MSPLITLSTNRPRFPKWNWSTIKGKLAITAGLPKLNSEGETTLDIDIKLARHPRPLKDDLDLSHDISDITRQTQELIQLPMRKWVEHKMAELKKGEDMTFTEVEKIQFQACFVTISAFVISNHPEYTCCHPGFSASLASGGPAAEEEAWRIQKGSTLWCKLMDYTNLYISRNHLTIRYEITNPSAENPFPTFKASRWIYPSKIEKEIKALKDKLQDINIVDHTTPYIEAQKELAEREKVLSEIPKRINSELYEDFLEEFNHNFERCYDDAVLRSITCGNRIQFEGEVEADKYALLLKYSLCGASPMDTLVTVIRSNNTSLEEQDSQTSHGEVSGQKSCEWRWTEILKGMKNNGYKVP